MTGKVINYSPFDLEPQPQEWLVRAMKRISWETTAEYMTDRFEFVDIRKEENDSIRYKPVL